MTDKYEIQLSMEQLHSKHQLLPYLRQAYDLPEIQDRADAHGLEIDFILDLLAQMYLHKQTTVSVLVGILERHFDTQQACADALLKAAEADFMDWDGSRQKFIIRPGLNAVITPKMQADLERFQYPMPMVVPPLPVCSNRDTGYITDKSSLLLNRSHHNDDICLDHINRANATLFRINMDTARMVKNQWKGLDRQKPDETYMEFQKRVRAFEKYQRTAMDVLEHLMILGNRFYITHRYDKRGRSYTQGYHVNPQGSDWNKACIEFAHMEVAE